MSDPHSPEAAGVGGDAGNRTRVHQASDYSSFTCVALLTLERGSTDSAVAYLACLSQPRAGEPRASVQSYRLTVSSQLGQRGWRLEVTLPCGRARRRLRCRLQLCLLEVLRGPSASCTQSSLSSRCRNLSSPERIRRNGKRGGIHPSRRSAGAAYLKVRFAPSLLFRRLR